jgi:hypothetical protein
MKLIDHNGKIIDDKEIKELLKTEKGKMEVHDLIRSRNVAFAGHQALNFLKNEVGLFKREMTYDERELFINVLYHSMFNTSQKVLEYYMEDVIAHLKQHNYMMPQQVGTA